MWLQQDGAKCHTTEANMALLQETFPEHVMSRRGDINWPPLICDLTQLNFLWGYAKDRVYANKPSTLGHNIRQAMAEIPPHMSQKVVENYLKRNNACTTSRGGHLIDVVFHTTLMSTFKLYNKNKYHERNILSVLFTFAFDATEWITPIYSAAHIA